jgi:hypothetical protein
VDLTKGVITSVFITLNGVYKRSQPIQTLDQGQITPPVQPPPLEMHALLEPKPILPLGTPLTTSTTSYARIVNEVAKMYTNSMKYDSYNSNFANKRAIFEDVY